MPVRGIREMLGLARDLAQARVDDLALPSQDRAAFLDQRANLLTALQAVRTTETVAPAQRAAVAAALRAIVAVLRPIETRLARPAAEVYNILDWCFEAADRIERAETSAEID